MWSLTAEISEGSAQLLIMSNNQLRSSQQNASMLRISATNRSDATSA